MIQLIIYLNVHKQQYGLSLIKITTDIQQRSLKSKYSIDNNYQKI